MGYCAAIEVGNKLVVFSAVVGAERKGESLELLLQGGFRLSFPGAEAKVVMDGLLAYINARAVSAPARPR